MKQYVAFLRGINVGGRLVKMAELKACFEQAGMREVRTVLQTGNVVFASDKSAGQLRLTLEQAVGTTFDYSAKILVYTIEQVRGAVADYPFARGESDFHSYIVFISTELAEQLVAQVNQMGLDAAVERVQLGKEVVFWRAQKGATLKSDFAKLLTKAAYKEHNTVRNVNTLEKVLSA